LNTTSTGFPGRFPHIDAAERHSQSFFNWYNFERKHSGIAMLTPHAVHYSLAGGIRARRQHALNQAFAAHPERFKYAEPTVTPLPTAVWIISASSNQTGEPLPIRIDIQLRNLVSYFH
jgi:putative transposase